MRWMMVFYHQHTNQFMSPYVLRTRQSNYDPYNPTLPFREIFASNREIRIWGAKTKATYLSIAHKTKETDWTTVFVDWSHSGGKQG